MVKKYKGPPKPPYPHDGVGYSINVSTYNNY